MSPLNLATWCAAVFLAATLYAHTVALRLVMLGAGTLLVAGALLRARLQGSPPPLNPVPPLWLPFALWAAWAALSYVWSIEPERTLKEFRNEIVYSALAFWLCWCVAQSRAALRIMPTAVAVAAAGACTSALWVYFGEGLKVYRLGLHGDTSAHSSALVVLMPCVVAAGWLARRKRWPAVVQGGLWTLAALFLLSGYTTLSRMFWLVIAFQFALLGGLIAWRRRALGGLVINRAFAIGAVMVSLAILAAGAAMMLRIQTERAEAQVAMRLSEDPRLQLWPEVIERIRERPMAGFGFGRGLLRSELKEELNNDANVWHAHNLFLDTALQSGLIGVLLLLALLYFTLQRGWRLLRSRDETAAACGLGLFVLVLGMLARNMTDVLWVRENALLYWGTVGTLLALGSTQETETASAAPPPK